ncbi:BglG family transcription antiterminator LicT [Neobacillus sp. YIM B06451]|uniref:BglG family transcription antiterminator LicT n=1 Tax=Neobacillus sp. YIM B06451 TaxID=3070994 RepID=UPI00292CA9FF|nr:PRD domain-containing protein [Neobacillus sp. YIM B06451]
MIISRLMNNNAIVALDDQGNEVILFGKGIGFQKKARQRVDEAQIEKKFVLETPNEIHYLEELMRSIPQPYITATNEIVETAKKELNTNFKENNLFISLVDHIAFAIERKKSNESIENPLLLEIKKFYPNEFNVGLCALKIIKSRTGIMLDEDEAGFIAFNIMNATLNGSTTSAREITIVITHLVSIIESCFQLELDVNSVFYIRFITHLKFFLYRLFSNKEYRNNDEYLYEVTKDRFKVEYECVRKIAGFLKEKYNYSVPNAELGYLLIHINSMIIHNKK